MIKVSAPATSANLGCGFDTLGLAVNLSNIYEIESTLTGFYCNGKEEGSNSKNLIVQSIFTAFDYLGYKSEGFNLNVTSDIPSARGLGSSSSCICAGLTMGYALANKEIDKEAIFQLANKIEGHADNVAPCMFGGAVLSYTKNKYTYHVPMEIHDKFKLCAFIPNFRLSTSKARKALPDRYKRKDIVFNISRAALLPLALEKGDRFALECALEDKIHQPYRKHLIKNYDDIFRLSKACNFCGIYLSGAGPTLMGVYDEKSDLKKLQQEVKKYQNWEIKFLEFDKKGITVEII